MFIVMDANSFRQLRRSGMFFSSKDQGLKSSHATYHSFGVLKDGGADFTINIPPLRGLFETIVDSFLSYLSMQIQME